MEQSRVRALTLLALAGGAAAVAWLGSRVVLPQGGADAPALEEVRRVVPRGERVVIEVLNGSGRQGAARIATRVLRRAGFDVIYFDNAPDPVDSTLVLVRRGAAARGGWLVEALGTGRVVLEEAPARRVDLTVILGPDWQRPKGVLP
ncbi:MAG: LytR C-terminal domain-containing protein [Gemmatimonadota bacterium]|nr:LytR C-terminal domain-containing protein [Gemmatimonadota bacterium]